MKFEQSVCLVFFLCGLFLAFNPSTSQPSVFEWFLAGILVIGGGAGFVISAHNNDGNENNE